MIKIGLTGGIGSGKTTVAKFFENLGVPLYIADKEAKKLMITDDALIQSIKDLLGNSAYTEGQLNKQYIRKCIFNDKAVLSKMNALVHPRVALHFQNWCEKQNTPYIISESALLFENGSYKNYDAIITVTAPESVRINRVMSRDTISESAVKGIINNQLGEAFKIENSDYIIQNIDLEETKHQVEECHKKILLTCKKIKN